MSKGVLNFYNTHMAKIDLLNDKMKKIRRIQADAHILYNVTHDPEILDKTYDAVVLTLAGEKSTVYIDELKWLTHGKVSDDANIYDLVQCKLFVFENEEKMSKKIRIQILQQKKDFINGLKMKMKMKTKIINKDQIHQTT